MVQSSYSIVFIMEAHYSDYIGNFRKVHPLYHYKELRCSLNEQLTFAYYALIKVREGITRICDYEIPLPDINLRL